VAARLTARAPASAGSTTLLTSSDVGAGTVRSWWGLSIDEPLGRCPFATVFSTVREEEDPASDTPVAAPWSRNSRTSPEPLLSSLRQKKRLSRPGAPSTDELPTRCIAFTMPLEREPATVPRTLPFATGFRRSFALRYDEEGLDSAASASSSPAGVRCHTPLVDILQSKRSASTTGESMEPNPVRSHYELTPVARSTGRFAISFQSGEAEWSRVRG